MPDRSFCRRTWGTLVFLAVLLLASYPRQAVARTWTDTKGSKFTANYERVQDDDVVLKRGVEIVRLPLAKLSPDDRAFVQQKLKEGGSHIWSDLKGRQIVAKPQGVKDGNMELKSKGQAVVVPFGQLSFEDQEFVREWLTGRGESALMPKPEENSRVWTDKTGRKVMASLESIESGRRLLLNSYGVEIPIAFDKLSDADKEFLRKQLTAEGRAELLFPRSREVAVAPAVRPSPSPVPPPESELPTKPPLPEGAMEPPSRGTYSRPASHVERGGVCPKCGRWSMYGADRCDYCIEQQRADALAKSNIERSQQLSASKASAAVPPWMEAQRYLGLITLAGMVFGWVCLRLT